MRVLFDNRTPTGVAAALSGHIVEETCSRGWDMLRNGDEAKVLVKSDIGSPSQGTPGAINGLTQPVSRFSQEIGLSTKIKTNSR